MNKGFIFLLGLLLLIGFNQDAKATIYRLGWSGTPVPNKDFSWSDYATLESLASANDTVQVYAPVNNPSITVTKPLRFIGYGYFLDINTGYQNYTSADQTFNITLSSGSSGSVLQGLVCSGVTLGDVSNITVRYCRIGYLDLTNSVTISSINIIGNWFDLPSYSGWINSSYWTNAPVTNLKIVNNYVHDIYLGGGTSGTIANNVFAVGSNVVNCNSNGSGSSSIVIKNNIVTYDQYWQCFFQNSTATKKNNLFAYPQSSCPGLTGNANQYSINMGITFSNWNAGVLNGDSSLLIPAGSPAINAGLNNANAATNCGIYGGETAEIYKQSGIPPVPAIYSLTTPTQTPTGSTMPMTVSTRSNNASNVTRVEYYVDNDPGYGLATSVTITASTNIVGATFNVALTGLQEGVHQLVVRSRDANGNWSLNNMFSFVKQYSSVNAVVAGNINKAEYYVDTDPGFGAGTNITVTAATDISGISIPLNPTNLQEGVHTAYVRSRDVNGKWSLTNAWNFLKPYSTVNAIPLVNINKLEYYIDTDPGLGLATNVSITPATDVSNVNIPLNPTSLPEGMHTAYIRSRDVNNRWSLANAWTFLKPYSTVNASIRPKLIRMEYYIDIDPGVGNAIAVAITPDTNISTKKVSINVSGIPTGSHEAWFRVMDSLGNWSLAGRKTFNLTSSQSSPSIITNGISKLTLCAGDSFKVSYDAKGVYNAGNIFTVQLSNVSGSFASPTTLGTYAGTGNAIVPCALPAHLTTGTGYRVRVVSSNPVVTGVISADSLWLRDRPNAQVITGASDVNLSTPYPYSVPFVTGSSWLWLSSAASINSTNNNATVNWNLSGVPQTLKVVETNQYGCVGDTSSKNVNVYALSIASPVPSTTTPCKGSVLNITGTATGVYDAGNVFTAQLSNASGSFASPINIGSVTLSTTGANQPIAISATMPNVANGTGYKVRMVSSLPVVTGSASVASITVSTPNMGNDTILNKCPDNTINLTTFYNLPGITYQYYNNSFVVIGNPATVQNGIYQIIGTGSTSCKDTVMVTINNYPKPAAQIITGTSDVNQNTSHSYSVPAVAGSTWLWIAPAASITPNTNTASLLWNTVGQPQTIKVVETNSFGCAGDTSFKSVNVYPLNISAATPSTTGPCKGSSFSVTANANGVYTAGNVFTAQLSNASGSFSAPTVIGTLTSNPLGLNQPITVPVIMPAVINGTGYKVRIVASAPAVTGANSVSSITVSSPNMGNDSVLTKCPDNTINLTGFYSAAGITYQYYNNVFSTIPTPTAVQNGIYNIIGTGTSGCKDTVLVTINNNPKPSLGANQVFSKCVSETYNLTTIYSNPSYTYQYYTNAFAVVGTPNAVAAGTYQIVATNASGCTDTAQVIVNNNNTPALGPDQVKYYLANSSYNLTTLYTNPVFTYSYRKHNWTVLPNPSVVYAATYYIIASYNACADTVKIIVKIGKPGILDAITGANDMDQMEESGPTLLVYPNPFQSQFKMDVNTAKEGNAKFVLTDLQGRHIKVVEAMLTKGLNTITLTTDEISSGVYFILFYQEGKLERTEKLIKE
ncbi:MAG: T9SS type A sorting domain-containing protein [Chitinophagaceae bacterium]|nr:T9SS type A sorting domain-containing protein [Chitinophagaceae bacterium]